MSKTWIYVLGICCAAGVATLIFQSVIRLEPCAGSGPCALILVEAAGWSVIWPVYWALYAGWSGPWIASTKIPSPCTPRRARVPPVDYGDKPQTPSGPIIRRQLAPFCSALDRFCRLSRAVPEPRGGPPTRQKYGGPRAAVF